MSKYGDDYVCTCEMHLVSARNKFHADSCELWLEPTFKDGTDEWDGDLGCLVLAQSPWENADEWIWNGDTPVVRKATADERTNLAEAVAEWEAANGDFDGIELIGEGEQEVIDALANGSATVDDVGLVSLPDGSYADFEIRTTWRRIDDGEEVTWAEELWDDPVQISLAETVYECAHNKKYYCHVCKLQRESESMPWRPWDTVTPNRSEATRVPGGYDSTYGYYGGCHHMFETFALPKRQHRNIKISGVHQHGPNSTPDYGLYAYTGWSPKCVAEFIPWQDYGLPTCGYVSAAEAIVRAWDVAAKGQIVEVGCMGGHGRTGTVLACLALLSDPEMTAKAAINWVRKVHCKEAIETNQQEWFIEWFRCWMLNIAAPEMPKTYMSKHSATWDAAKKAADAVKEGDCTHGPLCNGTYSTCESQSVIDAAKATESAALVAAQNATKGDAFPKAQSPAAGTSTNVVTNNGWTGSWCSHCHRYVYVQHNEDCIFELMKDVPPLPRPTGGTANARRRNARWANRRAAQRRKAQQQREMEAQL